MELIEPGVEVWKNTQSNQTDCKNEGKISKIQMGKDEKIMAVQMICFRHHYIKHNERENELRGRTSPRQARPVKILSINFNGEAPQRQQQIQMPRRTKI